MLFNDKIFKFFDAPADKGGESPKKEEDVIVEDIINTSTEIDELEAEIDKAEEEDFELNEFPKAEEDSPPKKTPDEPKDKSDKVVESDKPEDTAKEEIKAEEDKKKEETPPEIVPPVEDKDKDQQDKDELILDDELISKLNVDEDTREFLSKSVFKGKPLAEALKSYVNASKLVGKKKEELLKTIQPPKTELDNIPPKPKTETEVESAKEDLMFNELSKEFKDLPKDPADRKKWLNDLGYDDYKAANKFVRREAEIEKDIGQIWDYTEKLTASAPQINQKIMGSEIETISNYFAEKFQIDPKLLGYDLTVDAEGNNPVLDSLLASEDNPNEFDPELIQNVNGVKILKQGELAKKFFTRELPKIIEEVKSQTRRETIESLKKKATDTPSFSTQVGKGKQTKELETDQIKQITDVDQLDTLLDEEDDKHFK